MRERTRMEKQTEVLLGLELSGVIEKTDGTDLEWGDFIKVLEDNNLAFGGMVKPINLNDGCEVEL